MMTEPRNQNDRVQRGELTVKGLALETTARLRAWDLVASYSYKDARQTSVGAEARRYLDMQLPSVPRHSAPVWPARPLGAYGLPGFKVGGGVRYVGRTWAALDSVSVPAYTLVDAQLSYERDAWRVSLNISNLANKGFLTTRLERGDCWLGTQRKAVATVAYRW